MLKRVKPTYKYGKISQFVIEMLLNHFKFSINKFVWSIVKRHFLNFEKIYGQLFLLFLIIVKKCKQREKTFKRIKNQLRTVEIIDLKLTSTNVEENYECST